MMFGRNVIERKIIFIGTVEIENVGKIWYNGQNLKIRWPPHRESFSNIAEIGATFDYYYNNNYTDYYYCYFLLL